MVLLVKSLPANSEDLRDWGSNPGSGRCPGGGHDNPLQYSCQDDPMDRGAWGATVPGVTKESDITYQLHNNKKFIRMFHKRL